MCRTGCPVPRHRPAARLAVYIADALHPDRSDRHLPRAISGGSSGGPYDVCGSRILGSDAFRAQRKRAEPEPYRGQLSRVVMAVGGLMFLAHSLRVLGYLVLIQLGSVRVPSA